MSDIQLVSARTAKKVLIIHCCQADFPEVLVDTCITSGIQYDTCLLSEHKKLPIDVSVYCGVFLSVLDEKYPFPASPIHRPDIRQFLNTTLHMNIPLITIGIGALLLAEIAGSTIRRSPAPEFGWHEMHLYPAQQKDPCLRNIPNHFYAFIWNHCTFNTPENTAFLAGSESNPYQIFRIGTKNYGFLFHCALQQKQIDTFLLHMKPSSRSCFNETITEIQTTTPVLFNQTFEVCQQLCNNWITML